MIPHLQIRDKTTIRAVHCRVEHQSFPSIAVVPRLLINTVVLGPCLHIIARASYKDTMVTSLSSVR